MDDQRLGNRRRTKIGGRLVFVFPSALLALVTRFTPPLPRRPLNPMPRILARQWIAEPGVAERCRMVGGLGV